MQACRFGYQIFKPDRRYPCPRAQTQTRIRAYWIWYPWVRGYFIPVAIFMYRRADLFGHVYCSLATLKRMKRHLAPHHPPIYNGLLSTYIHPRPISQLTTRCLTSSRPDGAASFDSSHHIALGREGRVFFFTPGLLAGAAAPPCCMGSSLQQKNINCDL